MVRPTLFILLAFLAAGVRGHGYLVDPPGRASAWRYGFDVPTDYNDNECFCGGFAYQYQVNDGKCGICGDAWDEDPREHEVGSIYATGTLVRNYTQGQVIPVVANVTVNHIGHFEYKICANNNVSVEATQECLDLTPLYAVGHEEWFLYINTATGTIAHELQLPADLVCEQCVLQWRYVASNTWGTCDNGTEAVGCGPQEEFRACSDVSISPAVLLEEAAEPAGALDAVSEGEAAAATVHKMALSDEQQLPIAGELTPIKEQEVEEEDEEEEEDEDESADEDDSDDDASVEEED